MEAVYYSRGDDLARIRQEIVGTHASAACAIGFFDGVHIAHRKLIGSAREYADSRGLPLTVITFFGDNARLKPDSPRLFDDDQRCELLFSAGADSVLMCDFSALSDMSPEEFVTDFLINGIGISVTVVGYNFRFGKGGSGTADDLCALMRLHGGEGVRIDEIYANGTLPSSSLIRALLSAGKMRDAWALLGTPYFLTGKVTHGNGVGTGLGIPTVNTELPSGRFIPPLGVYSSVIPIAGRIYHALTNVGKCPTFGERQAHAETYVIDFSGDLYGQEVKIYLIDYLREERTFPSADELILQIEKDKKQAAELGKEIKWQEIGLK